MTSSHRQRITIADVADRAHVSIATVSRVLNQTGKVAPKTVAAVQAAVQELGYQPNAAARTLAGSRTFALGIVVDEMLGEYFLPMLRGIEIATRRAGYEFIINSTRRRMATGHYLLGENNTDGLIVFADSLPDSELKRLAEINFPIVLLHRSTPPQLAIPFVTVENKSGAFEMMNYLIATRGYQKFAFLRGVDGHEDTIWRERGYQEALAKHGLRYEDQLIGQGFFDEEKAHAVVTQWMRRGLTMDVIVAFDDDSAIGAVAALKEANKRVPEDIAIVGFDDIRLSRYLDPPLTTVHVPIEEAAQTAVEQLIRLIETGAADAETLLPTELVIRRSCGCC
jgi:LacI family transcriptional regulator